MTISTPTVPKMLTPTSLPAPTTSPTVLSAADLAMAASTNGNSSSPSASSTRSAPTAMPVAASVRVKCRSLAAALRRALAFCGPDDAMALRGGIVVGYGYVGGTDGAVLALTRDPVFDLPPFYLPRRLAERLVDATLGRCDFVNVEVRLAEGKIGTMTFPRIVPADLATVLPIHARVETRSRTFTLALRRLAPRLPARAPIMFALDTRGGCLVAQAADAHGIIRAAKIKLTERVAPRSALPVNFGPFRLDLIQRCIGAQPYPAENVSIFWDGTATMAFDWRGKVQAVLAGVRS